MKTMKETTSSVWVKLVQTETNDFSFEGIHRAITKALGEELFELDEIEEKINEGWIEICSDGVIVWG